MLEPQSVLVLRGVWNRGEAEVWKFESSSSTLSKGVRVGSRCKYNELVTIVKDKLGLGSKSRVELTYQWHAFMMMSQGEEALPVAIDSDDDVTLFVEMRSELETLNLCVTVVDDQGKDPAVGECSKQATNYEDGQISERVVVSSVLEEDNIEDGNMLDELVAINIAGENKWKGVLLETGRETDSDDNWHDFVVSKDADACGESSPDGNLQMVFYESGVAGDRNQVYERRPRRSKCCEETLDGIFGDGEDPSTIFGGDAPPVVNDVADDGIDGVLDDLEYQSDGIFVGRIFINKLDCKIKMAIHVINRKFHFQTPRSSPTFMEMVCVNENCPWRVYAAMADPSGNFQIRRANFEHTCPIDDRRQYHRQATTQVIGELIQSHFVPGRRCPGPLEIQRIMVNEFHVNISYWKAWRCREVAMEKAFGSISGIFALLPSYMQNLQNSNPGYVCHAEYVVDNNGMRRFKYLFVTFGASIAGLKYVCPVVLVDGTHLSGRYGGCLICASGQDANFKIFPITYSVVDSENDAAYKWFFKCLKPIVADDRCVSFISNRHNIIYSAMRKVYQNVAHGACLVHLVRNIVLKFQEPRLPSFTARATKAYTTFEFNKIFAELGAVSPECAEYLEKVGLPHWTRSHFIGHRYNIMTTNVVESLNKVLKECREFPLISMLKAIGLTLVSWFVRRRAASQAESLPLTPKVHSLLDVNFSFNTVLKVARMNPDEYEVQNNQGDRFQVDLEERTCSCKEFQMILIPCRHALAANAFSEKI